MTLIAQTLKEFSQNLASGSPVPGGGSASAYAGALGVSLYIMVLQVAAGKTEDKTPLERLVGALNPLRERLLELVDLDSQAFDAVIMAFRLPKEPEEEKAKRSQAIQAAMTKAAEVPLETMTYCFKTLKLGEEVLQWGAKSAASDIGVGTLLLVTGLMGAKLNVEINLPSIKDKTIVENLAKSKDQMYNLALLEQKKIDKKLEEIGI